MENEGVTSYIYYLLRMSEKEEQDFMTEYLTWMEVLPGLDLS